MPNPEVCSVNPELYLPLRQALRLLPNIRQALAREQLGRARLQARRAQSRTARLAAIDVTLQALEEVFVQDGKGRPRVSPMGAALLLRLHAAGAFEPCDPRQGTPSAVELERYANSLPALLQRQGEMEQARRAVDDIVEHPERVRPDQFSYEVLNRILHRHNGGGPGTLKVGGLEVTKHCRFTLNTKKRPKCALSREIPVAMTTSWAGLISRRPKRYAASPCKVPRNPVCVDSIS